MRKFSKFEGQKLIHEARKRDHFRSKLSVSKRARANEDADRLVDKGVVEKEKKDRNLDRKHREEVYDNAMETITRGIKTDKSVKRIVI